MAAVVMVLTLVVLPGCRSGRSAGARFSVVATTSVLAALVRSVTGAATDVRSIMPAGTDPHGFQPSARGRQTIFDAGLLVTNHDAFRDFARRFDLQIVGTIVEGRSTQAAPSAAHLADLARAMREQRICVVFAEESESTAWAESLAREVGPDVAVVRLYAGTLPDDSYGTMLRDNATRIATALARCA